MAAKSNKVSYLFCVKSAQMARRLPNSLLPSTEFIDFDQIYGVSFTVTKSTVDEKSVMCETLGQTIGTNSRVTDVSYKLLCKVAHAEAFRAFFSGHSTPLTGIAGTVTGEAITFPAAAGVWIELTHKRISSPVIASATLGVDYEVIYSSGKIRALAGGSLVGDTTTINYSYAAESGSEQEIGNLSQVEWAIHMELMDQYEAAADAILCEIDAGTVDPDGDGKLTITGPDDQEAAVMSFTGRMRTLPGRTAAARLNGMPVQLYNWPNI